MKANWQEIAKLGIMVAGGVILTLAGQPTIGVLLIGAAVGGATPGTPFAKKDGPQ